MSVKPLVIYIESSSSDSFLSSHGYNPERSALIHCIEEYCDCELRVFENDFEILSGRVDLREEDRRSPRIVLVIFKQTRRDNDHIEMIKYFRSGFERVIPIVVIPFKEYDDEETSFKNHEGYDSVWVFDYNSEGFLKFIKGRVEDWKPRSNWFGAHSIAEQNLLFEQLGYIGKKKREDDDVCELGSPDVNHDVVASALRLMHLSQLGVWAAQRQIPTSTDLVAANFDKILQDDRLGERLPIARAQYESEKLRILNMGEEDRDKFCQDVFGSGGGDGVSSGYGVASMAIDPVTLMAHSRYGYGCHMAAKNDLCEQLDYLHDMKLAQGQETERRKRSIVSPYNNEYRGRLVSGMVYFKVPGFTTPIFVITGYSDALQDGDLRVLRYLDEKGQYLPINQNGFLITEEMVTY